MADYKVSNERLEVLRGLSKVWGTTKDELGEYAAALKERLVDCKSELSEANREWENICMELPPSPEWDVATQVRQLRERLEAAEAVMEKIEKTKDGVPAVLGMTLYSPERTTTYTGRPIKPTVGPHKYLPLAEFSALTAGPFGESGMRSVGPTIRIKDYYSTEAAAREAAEAAKKENSDE